jgi:DNA-directed RNA polymerase subunit M/transcription elongation factor TFIIS
MVLLHTYTLNKQTLHHNTLHYTTPQHNTTHYTTTPQHTTKMSKKRGREAAADEEAENLALWPAEHLATRVRAQKLLAGSMQETQDVYKARALEEAIMRGATSAQAYEDKVMLLCAALALGAPALSSLQPLALLQMTEEQLAQSTPMGAWLAAFTERERKSAALLEDDAEDVQGILTCRNPNCKSKSIAVDQKQTRGGDESMTIFCVCRKCNTKWRL